MCNEAAHRIALGQLRDDWNDLRIPLRSPEGPPNMAPLGSVRMGVRLGEPSGASVNSKKLSTRIRQRPAAIERPSER